MKSWQIIVAVIVVILVGYFFLLSRSSNPSLNQSSNTNSDSLIYYWSLTCPHCKNVAAFLDTWPNTSKLKLDKREVSENRTNQALFNEAGVKCNIPRDQMGVPLLITPDNKCITGDQPVIEYFKSLFPESSTSATPTSTKSGQPL
ncbi:MAG: hypothetical protein PHQ59_00500 [Candidatus Daviesbacteria bacterium]|nr:hypothetical protein [Candidatus Daviesbacteria bacterium]